MLWFMFGPSHRDIHSDRRPHCVISNEHGTLEVVANLVGCHTADTPTLVRLER
jgi:hypothetical protein